MDLSSALVAANKEATSRLDSMQGTLDKLLAAQTKAEKVEKRQARNEAQAAKRASVDKKKEQKITYDNDEKTNELLQKILERLEDFDGEKKGNGVTEGLTQSIASATGPAVAGALKGLLTNPATWVALGGVLGLAGIQKALEAWTGGNKVDDKGNAQPGLANQIDFGDGASFAANLQADKEKSQHQRSRGSVKPSYTKDDGNSEGLHAEMGMMTPQERDKRRAFYKALLMDLKKDEEEDLKAAFKSEKRGRGTVKVADKEKQEEIRADYAARRAKLEQRYEEEGLSRKDERVPVQEKQKGGVINVPGSGSGDKIPMMLKPGSFVLNRNASNYLRRQEGGDVPALLEPGEKVYNPGAYNKDIVGLNQAIPRFGPELSKVKKVEDNRTGNGPKSEDNIAPALYQKGGKVFLHWAASGYSSQSPDYHATVQGDGSVVKTRDYSSFGGGHTSERNSEGVGISLAAMKGASPDNFGSAPVKPVQYEAMATLVAGILKDWGVGPSYVTRNNVPTHAEAGKDGDSLGNYGPVAWGGDGTRWDLWKLYQRDKEGTGGPKIRAMIQQKMGDPNASIEESDQSGGENPQSGGQFVMPLTKGRVGTGPKQIFGAPRDGGARKHAGVDLVETAPWGSDPKLPCVAAKDGVVMKERWKKGGYTEGLMIKQNDGYDTRYVHMTPEAKPGTKVKAGDRVGKLRDLKDQSHLHYELYKSGSSRALDPTPYLSSAGKSTPGGATIPGMENAPDGNKGEETGLTNPANLLQSGALTAAGILGGDALDGILGVDVSKVLTGLGLASGANSILNMLGVKTDRSTDVTQPSASDNDTSSPSSDSPSGEISSLATGGDAKDKAILDMIASVEAAKGDPYGGFNTSAGKTEGRAVDKTIDWLAKNANGAIGRYQHMPSFIRDRAIAAGFDPTTTKFTPEVQDKITLDFLKKDTRGLYDKWKSGENVDEKLGDELSRIWRGLPHSSGGTYPDQYAGRNAAHMTRPEMMQRIKEIKGMMKGGMKGKGKVPVMLEPGEMVFPSTTSGLEQLNSSIPRFQTGGTVGMSGAPSQNYSRFAEASAKDAVAKDSPPIIVNNVTAPGPAPSHGAGKTDQVPVLSDGPSLAGLNDIINRVSWSNVF